MKYIGILILFFSISSQASNSTDGCRVDSGCGGKAICVEAEAEPTITTCDVRASDQCAKLTLCKRIKGKCQNIQTAASTACYKKYK
jgi:hypothetical protein